MKLVCGKDDCPTDMTKATWDEIMSHDRIVHNDHFFDDFGDKGKFTHDMKVGDEFRVGGLLTSIEKIMVNASDELVFNLVLIGVPVKKRSRMTMIIPKKLPIEVLS